MEQTQTQTWFLGFSRLHKPITHRTHPLQAGWLRANYRTIDAQYSPAAGEITELGFPPAAGEYCLTPHPDGVEVWLKSRFTPLAGYGTSRVLSPDGTQWRAHVYEQPTTGDRNHLELVK